MASIRTRSREQTRRSPVKQEPQQAKDAGSMYGGQTAADSVTLNEQKQSFGNLGEELGNHNAPMMATDFTVAEDLHRRVGTTTPRGEDVASGLFQ